MNGIAGAANIIDRGDRRLAAALILLVAIATRFVTFGNPVATMDDQFYLLVGHDWWRGQLPYLDIWDRKPPGLFALYALIAGIGGGSILAVHLIATLFAAATGWTIRAIALYFAGPRAALLSALSYLFIIPLLSGQTGQSPVFYNLAMAGAALLLIQSTHGEPADNRRRAYIAMALCGLSMAIKQVAFVEGAYFGLAFLFLMRRAGMPTAKLAVTALTMVVIALLPTVIGILSFALTGPGALATVIDANFISIFHRSSFGLEARSAGFALVLLYGAPLIAFAALGILRLRPRSDRSLETGILIGWLLSAILGWIIVPSFFDHYALPLLVPLSVLAAGFYDGRSGTLGFIALAIISLFPGQIRDWNGNRAGRAWFDRLAATVEQNRGGGCIYLSSGPTALYQAVPACRLTRYLFPHHLMLATESKAVGVDTVSEVRRIMAARPAIVLTQDNEIKNHNPAADAVLFGTLRADYRQLLVVPDRAPSSLATIRVWQRSDLAPPAKR